MASRRKLPLVLFLITLVLLAGAVVLLLRGRPVTLERIAARQGYAITGQEEATVTLTLSREQMPEGFPKEVPISQAEGELKLPLLQDGDTTFYLTAFARSDEDPGTLYAVIQPSISSPGKGDSFSSPTGLTRMAASPPSSGFPTCPCRPTERTAPMRPGWPARARVNSSPCM